MIINGVKLEADFTDADFNERIEEGRKEVLKKSEEFKEKEFLPAEAIRQECKIIKDFVDYVFGDGTSQKIFGEKNSLQKCLDVFEEIAKAYNESINNFYDRVAKYSPDRLKR